MKSAQLKDEKITNKIEIFIKGIIKMIMVLKQKP